MILADSQPIVTEDFGDLSHRTGGIIAEVTNDDIGLVHQNARSFFQFRDTDSKINVTVVIRTADDNLGGLFVWTAQVGSNTVRRRGDLLDYFVQLFDRLPCLRYHFLLFGHISAKRYQLTASSVTRWSTCDDLLK